MQANHQVGIKMVLSGEGADELLEVLVTKNFNEETVRKLSKLHMYDFCANKSLRVWVSKDVPF
jgi:asparagine synthetase B (glutamine-hydrolysing)